ncbi:MAG: hypothetical protein QNJ53_13445 [Pleurocapsa sp. MO_192.B19]|nr:hypothetical protein [Pleurocapsa sp. MO_192.B19]
MTLKAEDFQQIELQNQLIQELAAIETSSESDSVQLQGEKLKAISDRF